MVSKEYWPTITSQLYLIAQAKSVEAEIEVNTPLGKRKAEYKSTPIWQLEKVVGAQSIIRDITERRKAEQDLRKSEESYAQEPRSDQDGVAWGNHCALRRAWGKG